MNSKIEEFKGFHPGIVLERELRERNIPKGKFAISLGEFPQTLVSITKGNRRMNVALAMKIEKALELEEGFFMILQVYHDIFRKKKKEKRRPEISTFRSVLFWDTSIENIDWEKNSHMIITRILKHGNEEEKEEITNFYGLSAVMEILNEINGGA